MAYDHVTQVYNARFSVVITQGAFADLIVCLTQFSKNQKFQKKSLQAIEALKASIGKLLRTPECPLSHRSTAGNGGKNDVPTAAQTQEEQFWFPVLFAFHDVLMTGDDLEVRSRALNYLFETLMRYGGDFPLDFWDTLWRQLLYPIFMVLRSRSEMSKVVNHEELSVWLSTTMIQALRNMITLFTHFFDSLEYMLDRFLDLLILCICQENDTLARIGSNCLQQLILQNVSKFNDEDWHKIVTAFVDLFNRTEATALFSAATSSSFAKAANGPSPASPPPDVQSFNSLTLGTPAPDLTPSSATDPNIGLAISDRSDKPREDWGSMGPNNRAANAASEDAGAMSADGTPTAAAGPTLESYRPPSSGAQATPIPVTAARRRFFNQIITQCVLTLLMIETVNELFSNDTVYAQIPAPELLRLMALLKKSYHFARRFNSDLELRTRLFREGFMRQPPNLLKQESGAAATYVAILLRMHHDGDPARAGSRAATTEALVPLCADILRAYLELDDGGEQRASTPTLTAGAAAAAGGTQARNMAVWRPVVVDVLEGYAGFARDEFREHVPVFAPLVVGLLGRDLASSPELQVALQRVVARVIEVGVGVECGAYLVPGVRGGRWGSRGR